jgi:O-antigen/teichoic acid export membrane protein
MQRRWQNLIAAIKKATALRTVILTAGSLSVARVITAAVQLALVPLLLTHLGPELFGTWVALCALQIILQVADFGLGNAMVNEVAKISHGEDGKALCKFVAERYQLLLLISVVVGIVGALLAVLPVWRDLLNITTAVSDRDLHYSLIAVSLISALQLLFNANQQIWLGMQEGMRNGISLAIGALLNLCAVAICVEIDAGLPWIIFSSASGSIVTQFCSTLLLFSKIKFRALDLFKERLRLHSIVGILKNTKGFFVIQLCGLLSFNLDVLLVSRFVGGQGVAEYSVVARLFSIPTLVLSLLLSGLWPVVSRAHVVGDLAWIRRTFMLTLAMSVILSGASVLGLYFASDSLIGYWTKDIVHPSRGVIFGFSAWVILTAIGGNIAIYLNGVGDISYQARMSVFFAFVNIAASLIFINIFGVSGPIWGSVFASSIYYTFAMRRVMVVMGTNRMRVSA